MSATQNTALIYAAAAGHLDESPLTLAAYKGHLEIVKYLLDKMGDWRNQEELHTALMEASMDGHLEVAKLLLDNGAPVNLASDSFESPLTLAACGGHCKLVEQLLDRGAELEEPNDEGYTPLMEASREGHRVSVIVYLWFSYYYLKDVDAVTATNDTALTYAAENGHLDVCSALIEYGANVVSDHTLSTVSIFSAMCLNERLTTITALMKAAKNGNYSVVQFLILRKVNKVTANNDANALSLACTNGHWEIVRLLLDHGADPCHLLKDGTSCIIEASRNGHTRVVETLLNWFGVPASPRAVNQSNKSSLQGNRVKKVDILFTFYIELSCFLFSDVFDVNMQTESNHDTALTLAATGGHEQLADLLIARGADIEHRDKKGFTPLILAATGGHVSVVELLLNAGAQIEAQSERTKDTALSLACSGGRKEVVELLLKRGANKEHRNVSDYTPLSLAASGGYVDIVNMLLNAGAEINSRTGSKLGISPLMLAAMNGHSAATRLLLERGSDINAHIETNRNTALTLACFQGRTEVVRLLLEYNANVEHRAKTGLTPLMEAANGGYVDVAEKLLNHGADPNAAPVPASRDTALTIAADKGHNKFVELLLHRGAQIDARNKKGCTALWLACNGGHLDTVQILVKHEADPDAQDNRRVSPLIIAFRKGHLKDLLARCHQCMEVIVSAKERQAAQANKNAETLLEIIAKEVFISFNILQFMLNLCCRLILFTLFSVSSNLIARVIGRAGGNINAIREATGAYIEVEKQNGKKEHIVCFLFYFYFRQAVEMINGLILDSESTVSEIVKRVTAAGGASAPGSHLDDSPYSRHSVSNEAASNKLPKQVAPVLQHTVNEVLVFS
uniref:ANK_REP_REGION domain-containing protein n=1 Tax=Syphacia muris TaxID=451379 RepID=A0A0N5AJ31_9BILA